MSNNTLDDTRQHIIETASGLFGTIGYTRATTRAIAEAAGVNEVTIFRHFGNKKNLLLACIETHNADDFSSTFQSMLTGDYRQDIGIMAKAQAESMAQSYETIRVLMCDAAEVPDVREMMLKGIHSNQQAVAAYFAQQIDAGQLRPELDPEVLASAFDSLFSSYVLFRAIFQADVVPLPADSVIEQLATIFIKGTLNG